MHDLAFLDYGKAGVLVFLENLLMLLFWAFAGDQAALTLLFRQKTRPPEMPDGGKVRKD